MLKGIAIPGRLNQYILIEFGIELSQKGVGIKR